MRADGSFVVAWQKVSVGQAAPILLQRYSAAGARIGAQIQANSLAGLQAGAPVLATDGTGEFMVAWQAAPAGAPTQIYVRAFRADGTPRAAETQISSGVGGSVPSIAANAAGNYAVSWVGAGSGTLYGPQLRLLHADGSVASPQVSVFAGPPYSNVPSPVAVDANGNAVLVNSINTLGGGPVSAQRISAR